MLTLPKYANNFSALLFTPFMNVEKTTIHAHNAEIEKKKSTLSIVRYNRGTFVKYLEMKSKKKRTRQNVYDFPPLTILSTTGCLRIKEPKQNGIKYFNKFTSIYDAVRLKMDNPLNRPYTKAITRISFHITDAGFNFFNNT